MNFAALPDHIFVKIFRYLPFKDRVRAAGVNRTFRQMSNFAVSQTKKLILVKDVFGDRFTPAALSALMKLCAENLEEIRFILGDRDVKPFVEAFVAFQCPNLMAFQCSDIGDNEEMMEMVLRNNSNLMWLSVGGDITYPNITSEKLSELYCDCTDDGLRSLTGRVPNLTVFVAEVRLQSVAVLNQFLGTVPKLLSFRIQLYSSGLNLEHEAMDSFWQLKSMMSLSIQDCDEDMLESSYIGDNSVIKMSESFPDLRFLHLPVDDITDQGLAALSTLEDLWELTLEYRRCIVSDRSAAVYALTKCGRLRKLEFLGLGCCFLSPAVLPQLFRSCPLFSEVMLYDLVTFESEEKAATLVASMTGIGKRKIRITFITRHEHNRNIWRSKTVKDALEKLEREEGVELEFQWRNIPADDADMEEDEIDFAYPVVVMKNM